MALSGLFLCEFDIGRGSTLAHAVPGLPAAATGSWLAEHMLPEGAHSRETDATVFYLRRQSAPATQPAAALMTASSPSHLCVNVVRTRLSAERARGADVKALAVSTAAANTWAVQLLPLLLAALDEYYDAPSLATATLLFARLNDAAGRVVAALQPPTSA
jgi:hypothetical protein